MKIVECNQYTPEWQEARRGLPTCSQFGRIITPSKGVLSDQAEKYICELIAERFGFGEMDLEGGMTAPMRHGSAYEGRARKWYALDHDSIRRVGLIVADDETCGGSPDSLVGEDGGLEIKCPLGKTHVKYLLDGCLPDDYKPQVHGLLIVSGRQWWDFMSYAPGMPPLLVRVEPNEYTDKLRGLLAEFSEMYADRLARVRAMLCDDPTDPTSYGERNDTLSAILSTT